MTEAELFLRAAREHVGRLGPWGPRGHRLDAALIGHVRASKLAPDLIAVELTVANGGSAKAPVTATMVQSRWRKLTGRQFRSAAWLDALTAAALEAAAREAAEMAAA